MNKIIPMGVINITPDSFSDGGQYSDPRFLDDFFNSFSVQSNSIIDIGAESTAPFNNAIDFNTEWKRLDHFLSKNISRLNQYHTLSFDTYKVDTMHNILDKYFADTNIKILWNDVSGDYEGSIELLKKFSSLNYVLCHNLSPKRELASDHMNYLSDDIVSSVNSFFSSALDYLATHGIDKKRIYLDPCFGFSKTMDQNYELIRRFDEIVSLHDHWLIGVSKKSFLRALSTEVDIDAQVIQSEYFHFYILSKFLKYDVNQMIFRVHDKIIFDLALQTKKLG